MSTPTFVANTTTATEFSYSLTGFNPRVTALTLTAFGSGFTYTGPLSDVQTGFVENAELSVSFFVDVPGVGLVENTYTYQLIFGIDESVTDLLADPDLLGAELREILTVEAGELEILPNSELLDLFTFDSAGIIVSGPNPAIVYESVTGPQLGTNTRDEILFEGTGGRLDTLGGPDLVLFDAFEGDFRVSLRNGDDVFIGSLDFTFFGALDPTAPTTWVNGGVGDDILFGGQGADQLRGFNDDDLIVGMSGEDRLFGGGGNDEIFGFAHRDVIFGGSGRDIIDGGLGNDTMSGGLGRDVFIFEIALNLDFSNPTAGNEFDAIQDFAVGLDTLHFREFGTDLTPEQAFQRFSDNAVQDGENVSFDYNGGTIEIRRVDLADFTVDSFYNRAAPLPEEFAAFDTLDLALESAIFL